MVPRIGQLLAVPNCGGEAAALVQIFVDWTLLFVQSYKKTERKANPGKRFDDAQSQHA
jgi:hypothetical protein